MDIRKRYFKKHHVTSVTFLSLFRSFKIRSMWKRKIQRVNSKQPIYVRCISTDKSESSKILLCSLCLVFFSSFFRMKWFFRVCLLDDFQWGTKEVCVCVCVVLQLCRIIRQKKTTIIIILICVPCVCVPIINITGWMFWMIHFDTCAKQKCFGCY